MICAEQKVQHQDKKGHISFTWEKISSHAANHMLDVETNNALAAEILGVRYLKSRNRRLLLWKRKRKTTSIRPIGCLIFTGNKKPLAKAGGFCVEELWI